MEDIKKLYLKAQNVIKKIETFYELNKNGALSSQNFKVYDVSFYIYDKMKKEFPFTYKEYSESSDGGIFIEFCNREFDYFSDDNDMDLVTYIGSTSTFYIVPEFIKSYDTISLYESYFSLHNFIEAVVYSAIDEFSCYNYLHFSQNNNIIFDDDYNLEYVIDNLETITNIDIDKLFADVLNFYNNLQNFKINQVAYFKEYCEQRETELKESQDANLDKYNLIKVAVNEYINKNLHNKEIIWKFAEIFTELRGLYGIDRKID